jgi:hypothetical protein
MICCAFYDYVFMVMCRDEILSHVTALTRSLYWREILLWVMGTEFLKMWINLQLQRLIGMISLLRANTLALATNYNKSREVL